MEHRCETCHRPLICPSCTGARGGRKKTAAKKASSARNIEIARAARWTKKAAPKKKRVLKAGT